MQPVEIFFSYAHEDEALMNDVRRQLVVYDRQRIITKWHRDEVTLDIAKEIMRVVREISKSGSVPKDVLQQRVGDREDRVKSPSIEDKWCNLDYIEKAGIAGELKNAGYKLTWALAEMSRSEPLEGWEEVIWEDKEGTLLRFKIRDRTRDYLLLLKKPVS